MEDADRLQVWYREAARLQRMGELHRDDLGRIGFAYDAGWRREGFPISCSLPLGGKAFPSTDGVAHRFFANLLPEGDVRSQIVRLVRVANTDFDLLRAIGGECAGAFALTAPGSPPAVAGAGRYRELGEEELASLASRRGLANRDQSGRWPRLSLAGAQHKCPVLLRDDRYLVPVDDAASSHILKFEVADLANIPVYEAFTTALARAVGLAVADVRLRTVDGRRYTEVVRFDRLVGDDGNVRRLHQEDFCQALGFGHERKYEADGGPGLAVCAELLREHAAEPPIDIERLITWQAFNWLAGNSDGHTKNLALLYSGGTIRLSPFYDLVCTRAVAHIDHRLAFAVGGEFDPGQITASHWQACAAECGIRTDRVHRLVRTMARRLLEALGPCRNAFEHRYGTCGPPCSGSSAW